MPSLAAFNRMPDSRRMDVLRGICSSTVWACEVSAATPFPDIDALLDRADEVLAALPDAEISAALDGHPRIGALPDNPSSAREQEAVATADDRVRAQLAQRNQDYENTFGYVYLVCASGRSADELLAVLTERLGNDPATEAQVMRSELAKINRLRLRRLLGEPDSAAGSMS